MLRKFFASLLQVVFYSAFFAFLYLVSIFSVFTSEDFYKDDLPPVLYDFAVDQIAQNLSLSEFQSILDEDDLREVLYDSISFSDFQSILLAVYEDVDQIEVAENGDVEVSLDLSRIKDEKADVVKALALRLYEKVPTCELLSPEKAFNSLCRSSALSSDDYLAYIDDQISKDLFADFHDEFRFTIETSDDLSKGGVKDFVFNTFAVSLFLHALFLCAILFFMSLLIFSPISSVISWIAVAVIVPSVFSALLGYGLKNVDLVPLDINLYVDLAGAEALIFFVFGLIGDRLLLFSLVSLFLSFALIFISRIFKTE